MTDSTTTPPTNLDIGDIMRLLPHRYPMLLIDRMEDMIPGQSAVGIKNVTINENFFQGHFPAQPVMPGVLIVEAMAQTAGAVVIATFGPDSGKLVYFMAIDKARFRKPVHPGDQLRISVSMLQKRSNVWRFHGSAEVNGVTVAEADYSAMIIDSGDLA